MFLSHFIISTFKAFKGESEGVSTTATGRSSLAINNVVKNPAVLNDIQILGVLTVFIATAGLPLAITGGNAPETADQVLLLWLPMRQYMGLIFPLLFFYFNPAIRNHFKRDFWDKAPNCFQKYNPYLLQLESPEEVVLHRGPPSGLEAKNGIGTVLKAVATPATLVTKIDINKTDENSVGLNSSGALPKSLTFGSEKTGSKDIEDLENYLDNMTHAKVIDLSKTEKKTCTIINVKPFE